MESGHQQTVSFHVDDCKLSRKDKQANTRLIETLKAEYESIFEDGSRQDEGDPWKAPRIPGHDTRLFSQRIGQDSDGKVHSRNALDFADKLMPEIRGRIKDYAAPKGPFQHVDERES